MFSTPFQVALWIELLAAGLGGRQGALFAAGERHRRIDVLGVIVIGLAVSLGGSLLRDIVLNQRPVVLWENWYLLVAGAGALLGMLVQPVLVRADWLITVLDAVVMGLFGAIAAHRSRSRARSAWSSPRACGWPLLISTGPFPSSGRLPRGAERSPRPERLRCDGHCGSGPDPGRLAAGRAC